MSYVYAAGGVNIYVDPHCAVPTETPIRVHKKRKSTSLKYHQRVQKKWNKRWGFVMKGVMYRASNGVWVCHPSMVQRLKHHLGV